MRGGQAEIEEGMNGTAALRRSVGGGGGAAGGGTVEPAPVATLVVYKDDAGYGMKVSGDNPVYVQSVKEGVLPCYRDFNIRIQLVIFISFN